MERGSAPMVSGSSALLRLYVVLAFAAQEEQVSLEQVALDNPDCPDVQGLSSDNSFCTTFLFLCAAIITITVSITYF